MGIVYYMLKPVNAVELGLILSRPKEIADVG